MNEYAVTVLGADRPGIIAEASEILAGLGLNLTDSTMTRLRGHFAMTLVCAGEAEAPAIETALTPLTAGGALVATVRGVDQEDPTGDLGEHYLLTVHGADRLGIVAALTRVVAEAGGNITDLTTRLVGHLYVLVAEVDLPAKADQEALDQRLHDVATGLGVEATFRAGEADLL
ncbi:MAG: amino acid-binding protein [Micromonosporaceae bacterium]|nr:amino acid-binding protein [Micromonosporaceae bacterium]